MDGGTAALGAWIFATMLFAIPMIARYALGRAEADAIYKPNRALLWFAVALAVLLSVGAQSAAERSARSASF